MTELQPYQTRLARASEIREGDFLDYIEPNRELRGPRGGRYRYDGLRVESRVITAEQGPRGFTIVPATGAVFTLRGNLADLTGAVVRRGDD